MSEVLQQIINAPDAPRVRKREAAPKIKALHDRNPHMSNAAIARRVGCSTSNVQSVLARYLADVTPEELAQYQENRADIFDAIGSRALASITPEKLAKASPAELTTVMGILYDKARLERGQATGINVSVLMDVVEAIKLRGAQPAATVDATGK